MKIIARITAASKDLKRKTTAMWQEVKEFRQAI
ncbi:hypothetical protein OPIT5_28450 [Opitutaceae bacterium TAV5]|nr:hypothetical protein OPIT5_28450 [Opitutaceae bacterium TAV5]